ncbi:hypothetical protein HK098_002664 [Nowakowskiella sp. JEL0407]|nr:hypothetical protein HK098_002664 [Nowakowskiella sp. JEL0407]
MSVVVSYNEDSHSVIHEFNSYLPLKNLHYASSSKSHVINDLSITFKKFTDIKSSVLLSDQSVFLHLFFVFSDDAEFYKTNIRKQIQDWLNSIASKKTQEWLVIHVSPALSLPDSTTKKRFYSGLGSGGSILDRIKSDFSTKRERCCGLKLNDEDSWKDFLGKVKEGILSSFSMQVQQFDEDIKRLDSQRLMPGWNYCQFFILKETSALLFESMTLYEDALLHYDELEASFFQTLAEQGAPWFTTFGGTDLHDDSDDILNFKKKPYRELIFQNKITIFDFRVYLFSRQVLLVEKLGRVNEVCVRAKKFLVEFVRNLREYRFGLPNSFCESWVYSACMSVVSQCEELVVVKKFSSFTMMAYESAKAELLHLARMQLDSLGKISGLYNPENDSIYTPEVIQLDLNQDEFKGITNTELKKALTNVEFFDELYLVLVFTSKFHFL